MRSDIIELITYFLSINALIVGGKFVQAIEISFEKMYTEHRYSNEIRKFG